MLWTHLLLSVDTKQYGSFLEELASLYRQWGWEAISFFARYSSRHFVALERVAKKYDIKPVYMVEVVTHAPGGRKGFPAFVVAKNQAGVEALYTLVSNIHQKGKQLLPREELELLRSRCFLLIGEELEETQEEKLASVVEYYQRVWGDDWYVICHYSDKKPIQRIRHLVKVVNQFHLRTLAAITQPCPDGFFSGYEDVKQIFHNHPEFVDEVENFLARLPVLSALPNKKEEGDNSSEANSMHVDWRYRASQEIIQAVVRYRLPFLVMSVPVDMHQWFHELWKRYSLEQHFLFQVQRSRLSLSISSAIRKRLLRWIEIHFQGRVGYFSSREHGDVLLLTTFEVGRGFSLMGEIEGIPIVQTSQDVFFSDHIMIVRLEEERKWDLLHDMRRMGCDVRWKAPVSLRWLDHPYLLDEGFISFRRHVLARVGDFLRDISRTMHPFLSGPFVYVEEAFLYLRRFISHEEARLFLLLLKRDDPRWVEMKKKVEESMPEEEKCSFYWQRLIREGRYLLSRRQERLRRYPLALMIIAMQHFPLEFTVCWLNRAYHLREKNRFLLYARLVWGVECLPPSINMSSIEDRVEKGKIRLGLRHLKKIPRSLMFFLIKKRPYKDFFDFLHKHPQIGKKTLEEWIRMGLFDDMEPDNGYKLLLEKKTERGEDTLFDETSLWQQNEMYYEPRRYEPISVFESCGLYAFEHPLDAYRSQIEGFRRHFLRDADHIPFGVYVVAIVGSRVIEDVLYYEVVDETAWKRVVVRERPSFSPEMEKPYIFRIVVHEGKLEAIEIFAFVGRG